MLQTRLIILCWPYEQVATVLLERMQLVCQASSLLYILAGHLWPCWQWPHSSVCKLTPDPFDSVHSITPLTPLCASVLFSIVLLRCTHSFYWQWEQEWVQCRWKTEQLHRHLVYIFLLIELVITTNFCLSVKILWYSVVSQASDLSSETFLGTLYKHAKRHMIKLQENNSIKLVYWHVVALH